MSPASTRVRRAAIAAPLALALLLAAGCAGGDDDDPAGAPAASSTPTPSADEVKIAELARFVVTTDSGAKVCRSRLTADFVRIVFGTMATCEDPSGDTDPADVATGADVKEIKVDGDSATASVTEVGGSSDGATGTWAFARDGADWRVAKWNVDYLRSGFKAQLGPNYKPDGADDPFADATARTCVSDKLQALADEAFLDAAYEIFRGSQESTTLFIGLLSDCAGTSGAGQGISTLRKLFENGIRASSDLPPDVTACLIENLRDAISDAEIRTMSENTDQDPPPAVQKRIEEATLDCLETTKA